MKIFCGSGELVIPTGLHTDVVVEGPDPSRVGERRSAIVQGVVVTLGPSSITVPEVDQGRYSRAFVAVRIGAGDLGESFERMRPVVGTVLDSLSFQAQSAIHVESWDVLDVTPPMAIGDRRDHSRFVNADAFFAPKFMPEVLSTEWRNFPVPAPTLDTALEIENEHLQRSLWWYVKSLDTPYAIDRFIALWTALECLWTSLGPRVQAPYVAECGHQITACPEPGCGASIDRLERGESLRRLIEMTGCSAEQAATLWKLRQVVHGRDAFSRERSTELGTNVTLLRGVVLACLKHAMGLDPDKPPKLARSDAAGWLVVPLAQLIGGRTVTEVDMDLAQEQQSLRS